MVIVQHGNRLTAQSLPGASSNPDSPLTLDLTVDRNVDRSASKSTLERYSRAPG